MLHLISRSIFAVSFTVGVFLVMSYLIAPGGMPPEPTDDETQITITRKKRDENSIKNDIDIPTPPKTQNSPPPLMAMAAPSASLNNAGFRLLTPSKSSDTGVNLNLDANRRAIPIVSFPPEYPQRLLQRGIEGWVMLEFTIAPDGSVTDIQVVDSEPENAFDSAAIRSLQRWSYQPKMVDGRPVAQTHMREVFRFEIKE